MSLLFLIFLLISLFLLTNSYLLYPLVMNFLSSFKSENTSANFKPSVSILISAHNEEKVIRERIANLAGLNYNFDQVQVLIGSDNSSDSTNDILNELKTKYDWLEVHIFEIRQGKAGVLNKLVEFAKHEILVFSDANTVFDTNAISELVLPFRSENIGGVCGRLILGDSPEIINRGVEEKQYWHYETRLKLAEGRLGVLIGANGGIFAIRRDLFRNVPTAKAVTDDLFLSLEVLNRGFQFVFKPEAIAFEEVGADLKTEFRRKIRFAATNFQVLYYFKRLLFNRNPLLIYAFWSHKLFRWITPFLLVTLLLSSMVLFNHYALASILLYVQILFYLLAALGALLSLIRIRISIFSMPMFFVMTNIAFVVGTFRFLTKKHSVIWETTKR